MLGVVITYIIEVFLVAMDRASHSVIKPSNPCLITIVLQIRYLSNNSTRFLVRLEYA